uniref:Uncharacterized protein n=1 Tax=Poecilia formosa TaxID=48698 RepID=A0A096LUP6_POEFO
MSSVQQLRDFIRERLTAAAEEIFIQVEKTIVRSEEDIKLLETCWKPQIKLTRIELKSKHKSLEPEASYQEEPAIRQNQEEPEPPEIRPNQEEPEPPEIRPNQEEPEPPEFVHLCVNSSKEEPEPVEDELSDAEHFPSEEDQENQEGPLMNEDLEGLEPNQR